MAVRKPMEGSRQRATQRLLCASWPTVNARRNDTSNQAFCLAPFHNINQNKLGNNQHGSNASVRCTANTGAVGPCYAACDHHLGSLHQGGLDPPSPSLHRLWVWEA